jgi:hypothetical protein
VRLKLNSILLVLSILAINHVGSAQTANSRPAPAQKPAGQTIPASDTQTQKVRSKASKIGANQDVTITLKTGEKHHGFMTRVGDTDLELAEVDLKVTMTFRYDELKNVSKGYGPKNFLGRRVSPRARLIGTIVGFGVVLVLPIVLVATQLE